MRCTYTNVPHDVNFDRARYQQFLREQKLSERAIERLNIHFIPDFTLSHLRGSEELRAGGAFFRRSREYIANMNETAPAFYRPVNPDNQYATIFLRPMKCHMATHLINRTFLHETRHHIQHCLNLPYCRSRPENAMFASLEWKDQPWEKDAENFARDYVNQVCFFLPVPRPWKRSDLPHSSEKE
jgi:hypothetical protein